MNRREIAFILLGLLLSIVILRFVGIQMLKPSLGLDSVYLQTTNIFSKMEADTVASVFNPQVELSLPLDACFYNNNIAAGVNNNKIAGASLREPGMESARAWAGSLTESQALFNLFAGNVKLTETDFEVYPRSPGGSKNPLSFTRHYNSAESSLRSSLGFGWSPFWDIRAWLVEDVYVFRWPTGDILSFKYDAKQNGYVPLLRAWMRFSMILQNNDKAASASLVLSDPNGQSFEFTIGENGAPLQLSKIYHGTGIHYSLKWDAQGKHLESVTEDPTGRKTEYAYNKAAGADSNIEVLSSVTFPSGKKIQYEYDTHQNLSKVTNETETFQRIYSYDNSSFHHQMTGMGDDKIQRKFHFRRQKLEKIEVPGFGDVLITRDSLLGLCQVQWMNGAVWSFYNSGENVLLVEGPLDFKEKILFDDKGLPVKITDSQNWISQNIWNDQEQLIQKQDFKQAIESFDYDANHNMVGYTDRLGNTTQFQYKNSFLKRIITPSHNVFRYSYYENLIDSIVCENDKSQCRFRYDKSGLLLVFENEKGLHTRYKYNLDGYLVEKTSPNQWTEIYTWDGNQLVEVSCMEQDGTKIKHSSFVYAPSGQLMSKSDRSNQKTQFEHDLLGRLVQVSDFSGHRKQFSWSGEGFLLKSTEDNGQTVQYTYDLLARLIRITKNEKASWNFKYAKNVGILIAPFSPCFSSFEDPQGLITQLSYDKNYLVSEVRLPDGRTQTFEYNAEGLLTAQNWPSFSWLGEKFSYVYDQNKHVESIYRHAEDKVTFYAHDWRGHLISGTDSLYQTFFVGYDAFGNPISLRKGIEDPFLEWKWNDDRFLTEILDPKFGFEKKISANGLAWRTSLFDTQYGFKEWTHTFAGDVQSSVDQMGRSVENTYYDNHKLKTKTLGNLEYTYFYDLSNRLKRMSGVAPCEYTWSDDGKLLKLTFDKKTILLMAYSDDGKLVKKTYPSLLEQHNQWNAQGLLENISEKDLDIIQYEYDTAGRMTWIRFPNKVKTQIDYDTAGRTNSILTTNDTGETLFRRLYQYDAQNRVSQIATERGELQVLRDVHGRVISQTCDDKARTGLSYTFNDKDQIETLRKKNAQGESLLQWVFDSDRGLLQKIIQTKPPLSEKNPKSIWTNLCGTVLSDGFLEVNKEVIQMDKKAADADKSAGARFQADNVTLNPGTNNISVRYINSSGRENKNECTLQYDPNAVASFLYDLSGKMIFQSQQGSSLSYQYNDEGFLETVQTLSGKKLKTIKYQYYGNGLLCFRKTEVKGDSSQTSNLKLIFDEQENLIGEFDQDGSFDSLYMFSPEGSPVYRIDRGRKKFYYHLDKDGSVIGITNHLGQIMSSYSYDFLGQIIEKKETLSNSFLYLGHYYDANADMYFHKGFIGTPKEHFQFFNPANREGIVLEEPAPVFSKVFPTYAQAFPKIPNPFDWVPSIVKPQALTKQQALETLPVNLFMPTPEFLSQPEAWACRPSHESSEWFTIMNVRGKSNKTTKHPLAFSQTI